MKPSKKYFQEVSKKIESMSIEDLTALLKSYGVKFTKKDKGIKS